MLHLLMAENKIGAKSSALFLILFMGFCSLEVTARSALDEKLINNTQIGQDEELSVLYRKARDFFNNGDYEKSIEISKSIINFYGSKGITDLPAGSLYELSFYLIADCQVRLGKLEAAQAALAELISAVEKGIVPRDTLAEAKLKSANIYLEFQNYGTSLRRFEEILQDFPDSAFSIYAKEKIKDISASMTGEIKGLVKIHGAVRSGGISVNAFNGFGTVGATTAADGSYILPIYRSTKATYLVLTAFKDGFLPSVKSIALSESGESQADKMELAPLDDIACGVLTGVCCKTIQGGKLKPVFGINSFVPGVDIVLAMNEARFYVRSDEKGVYQIILPPGAYKLLMPPGRKDKEIEIIAGRTSVFHIAFPGIKVD